jgi:hypothetical protein
VKELEVLPKIDWDVLVLVEALDRDARLVLEFLEHLVHRHCFGHLAMRVERPVLEIVDVLLH